MMERTFMTNRMYEARRNAGMNITKEEILTASDEIHDRLITDVSIAKKNHGRDYITYIPEQRVGKTYNLVRIAAETGYPIIVHNSTWADFMRREAKKHGWNINFVLFRQLPLTIDGMMCDVMLKDEDVDIVYVRDRLNGSGLEWVNVVGIN